MAETFQALEKQVDKEDRQHLDCVTLVNITNDGQVSVVSSECDALKRTQCLLYNITAQDV